MEIIEFRALSTPHGSMFRILLCFKKMTKVPPPSVHFGLGGIFEVVSEAELVYISALVEDFRSTVQEVCSALGNLCFLPGTQITINAIIN